jgi:opacity protein-like surface antigen
LFGPGSHGIIPAGHPVTLVGAALNDSQTRVGWTAGVGVEKKFSRNWSAKLEYLNLDFGTKTYFGEPPIRPMSASTTYPACRHLLSVHGRPGRRQVLSTKPN